MSRGKPKPPKGWHPGRGPKGSQWLGRANVPGAVHPPRQRKPVTPVEPEPVAETFSPTSRSPKPQTVARVNDEGFIPMAEGGAIAKGFDLIGSELQEGIDYLDKLGDFIYAPFWDNQPWATLIPGWGADSDPRP